MNSDKDKEDNQKRFHLLWVSPWFVKLFLLLCDWSAALGKECQKRKKVTHHWAPPCSNPSIPHFTPPPFPNYPLAPLLSPPFPLVLAQLPHGLLWPILHLPKPTTDAWCVKKVRSSAVAEAPFLPVHRGGLPCGFIIICRWHSAQVQAQCKHWHQRGGMRLVTLLVISCP